VSQSEPECTGMSKSEWQQTRKDRATQPMKSRRLRRAIGQFTIELDICNCCRQLFQLGQRDKTVGESFGPKTLSLAVSFCGKIFCWPG